MYITYVYPFSYIDYFIPLEFTFIYTPVDYIIPLYITLYSCSLHITPIDYINFIPVY